MTDVLTPTQRHLNMSHIRSKNTKPEILVRKWLWQHGFRYRLNVKDIPGRPDIVMRKYKNVIFVNGCFWHGHDGCDKFVMPKSNVGFWQSKISRNRERDLKNYKTLQESGWNVIVVWECRLKAALIEETMREVAESLNNTRPCPEGTPSNLEGELTTHHAHSIPRHTGEGTRVRSGLTQMVAEPEAEYKAEKE